MKVFVGCITDKGNYRDKNQDRAVCHIKRSKNSVLAVGCVCDGIGSFEQSEIAAEMMTSGITRWFEGIVDYFPGAMSEDMLLEDLEITIRELNELVYTHHLETGIDIGCTMSVFFLVHRNYYVFHVGDSRIYCAQNALYQITRDEVSVTEAHGKVKSRLANYIGKSATLWVSKIGGVVRERDLYIIGSDGLFEQLEFEDIEGLPDYIKSDRRAQKACEKLLDKVLARGARDNISCILLQIGTVK